jgi:hypothetical protein
LKFKFLFLLFNTVIILFLLTLFFMPLMILGGPVQGGIFLRSFWPLAAVFVAVLIILDIYYFSNRKLFRLLEREDWPALAEYLETRLPGRTGYPGYLVRLYANTCLVLSDSGAVTGLENKLALVKPALVEQNALLFGAARILGKDYQGALRFFAARDRPQNGGGTVSPRFFGRFFGRGRAKRAQWLSLYHGFSLLLDRRFGEAAEKFRLLAAEAAVNSVAAGLAAWFLADKLSQVVEGSREAALAARERIRSTLARRTDWDREIAKIETEIYAAILRTYINDAGNWIYNSD